MFRIIAGILVAFILSIAVLIYFGLYAVFRAVLYNTNERKSGHVPLPTGEGYDQHQESMQELVDLMKEIPYEEVSVRSFDNLTLYGRYYEVKKEHRSRFSSTDTGVRRSAIWQAEIVSPGNTGRTLWLWIRGRTGKAAGMSQPSG